MARPLGRRDVLKAMAASALIGPRLARADDKSVPEQIVDTMNVLFGKHPGFRSAHAKGIVCEGEFTPAAPAATLSKASHLRGQPVKVTVRFSDSTGIPDIPDGVPEAGPRGLAVRFHLPGGGSTDIVANAFNGFGVATGEDFLAFLKAVAGSGKGAPKPTPLEKFLAAHPRAMRVVRAPKPVPASFATETYFGVNAFEFTNAEGKSRFGRYCRRHENLH
jgi:catalase